MGMRMGAHGAIGHDPERIRGERVDRTTVRRVVDFARPYRWMLVGFLATILLGALLTLVPPLLFGRIIDSAIADGDRREVNVLAALIVGAAILEAILSLLERWWSARVGEGLIFDLRVALYDHVQRMPIAFFTNVQTGSLISRMNNDVIGAQRAFTGTLGALVSNGIVLGTTLITMFILEWQLTLLSLALLPVFILPTKRVGRTVQGLTRQSMELNASMNTTMNEKLNVSGALLVKLFGRHQGERQDFADRAGQVRDIGVRSAMYGRTFFIGLSLVGAIAAALIYWLGANMVISGTLTVGTLAALSLLVVRIYTPLTSLTNARIDVMTAFVSFERVFEVLDLTNPISDRPGAIDLVEPSGAVRFEGVGFTYPIDTGVLRSLQADAPAGSSESGPVLHEIDVAAAPGEMVAIVGPSGAGKSTLVSLIPRLYDVDVGRVTIDGHDVRDLTQGSLRKAIGVVSQDPHLFHDTVGANLRYARPDATDEEILEACRGAQILDVIQRLPDGLDTVVGERGYRLSGGEKQRVAIARMLLKDPAVVVLDEATSHLDTENEALVQAALATALEGRTSFVIAHRLSTITEADQIIVIDEGRVVERGRHHDLLADARLYAELYETLVRERAVG